MDKHPSLGSLTRSVGAFVRFVLPYLWRAVVLSLAFMGATTLSVWSGLKVEADRIAEKIMYDAGAFVPQNLHGTLESFSKAISYVTVFVGYIVLAHITVWLWHRLSSLL